MTQPTTRHGWLNATFRFALPVLLAGCSTGGSPDPHPAPPGMNIADAALDGGMPETALNVTRAILASDPRNVAALVRQGAALEQLNHPEAATEAYQRALAVDPVRAAALLGLGRLELSRGSAADAEHTFAKLLTRTPNDGTAMNNLGVALDLQGHHAAAQDVYEKLLRIDPNNRAASVNLALSLSLSGQADQSVAILRGPAAEPDATPRMRQDLAVALALSGNKREAEKLLLTDLSPADAAAALAGYERRSMLKSNDQETGGQGRGDQMPAIRMAVASDPGVACLAKVPDRRTAGGAGDGAHAMNGRDGARGMNRAVNGRAGKPGRSLARQWLSRLPAWLPGRLLGRRHGTAAVELALIAPILVTLFAGTVDFARAFDQEIALSSAVSSAAQYALLNVASINSTNAASLAATLSGIVANSNGPAWAGATVTVNDGATSVVASGTTTASGTAANANSCWCPTVAPAPASPFGTAVTCGSACAAGTLAGKFVTITGTRAFSAILGKYSLIGNKTLHQRATVQAQ